ncbi:hypothetical protein ACA910_008842 [Epithemia clementina (nom. ined.)]
MTNENGTPAQPRRKRVRIDDEVTVITPKKATEDTPSIAARNLVKSAVASHQEPIQVFLLATSKEYNALKSKHRQQESSLAKLKEDNFVPRSARVHFELTAPDRVKETTDFKKHKTNVEKALAAYQKECKKSILGTAELLNDFIKKDVSALLLKTILNLCHLVLVAQNPDKKNPEYHRLAYYMVQHCIDAVIFTYTWTTKTDIQDAIKEDDNVNDQMDTEDATIPATQDNNAIETIWTYSTTTVTYYETLRPIVCSLLKTVFVDSWNAQLAVYQKKAVDTALSATAKRIMDTKATEDTAQQVDAEPSIGPKKIKELIENEVKTKTIKLQTELNKLSEKIQRSKNDKRGTPSKPSSGAPSSTKNNDGKRTAKNGAKNGNAKNESDQKGKKPQKPKKGHGNTRGSNAAVSRDDNTSPRRSRGKQQPRKKQNSSRPRNNKN